MSPGGCRRGSGSLEALDPEPLAAVVEPHSVVAPGMVSSPSGSGPLASTIFAQRRGHASGQRQRVRGDVQPRTRNPAPAGKQAVGRGEPPTCRRPARGAPGAAAARLGRVRASSRSPAWPSAVATPTSAGCGSQVPAGPNPNGGSSPDQGRGTRQPSRPVAPPVRTKVGVLAQLVGEVEDLLQAELLALVDVGAAGQGQHEQRGRAGAARSPLCAAAVAGDVPGHVVVRQHPGGGGADRAQRVEAVVDRRAQGGRVPRAIRKLKLKAVCSSSGRR